MLLCRANSWRVAGLQPFIYIHHGIDGHIGGRVVRIFFTVGLNYLCLIVCNPVIDEYISQGTAYPLHKEDVKSFYAPCLYVIEFFFGNRLITLQNHFACRRVNYVLCDDLIQNVFYLDWYIFDAGSNNLLYYCPVKLPILPYNYLFGLWIFYILADLLPYKIVRLYLFKYLFPFQQNLLSRIKIIKKFLNGIS